MRPQRAIQQRDEAHPQAESKRFGPRAPPLIQRGGREQRQAHSHQRDQGCQQPALKVAVIERPRRIRSGRQKMTQYRRGGDEEDREDGAQRGGVPSGTPLRRFRFTRTPLSWEGNPEDPVRPGTSATVRVGGKATLNPAGNAEPQDEKPHPCERAQAPPQPPVSERHA